MWANLFKIDTYITTIAQIKTLMPVVRAQQYSNEMKVKVRGDPIAFNLAPGVIETDLVSLDHLEHHARPSHRLSGLAIRQACHRTAGRERQ